MNDIPQNIWHTPSEARDYTGVSHNTLHRYTKACLLKHGLDLSGSSQQINEKELGIKKVELGINKRNKLVYRWDYEERWLDNLKTQIRKHIATLSPTTRDIPENTDIPHVIPQKSPIGERGIPEDTNQNNVDTHESNVGITPPTNLGIPEGKTLVDKDYLGVLKEDRESKKQIEKDKRDLEKSYQMKDETNQRLLESVIQNARESSEGYKKQIEYLQKRVLLLSEGSKEKTEEGNYQENETTQTN